MQESGDILRVTEQLYAAAVASEEWNPALTAVVEFLRGDHAVLIGPAPASSSAPFVASARVDPRHLEQFLSPDAQRLMTPLFNTVPSGVTVRTALFTDSEFERTAAYNEVIRPMNGFHGLHARRNAKSAGFVLNVCRSRYAENFETADVARLRAILPHLATVIELRRRLQNAERGYATLAHLIDRLETGVILTDGMARPVMLNAAAERIVGERDCLAIDAAGLAATTPAATRLLRERIEAAAREAAVEPQRIHLDRQSRRLPLLATILPISRIEIDAPGAGAARVGIFLSEPDLPPSIDRDAVARTFRLTPRESEIAILLADGSDREMVAMQLGIGVGTVREHLRQVFAKTGVRSQPALLGLLRGFADPLRRR